MPATFFCVTDTHGQVPPPTPAEADAVLHVGDVVDGWTRSPTAAADVLAWAAAQAVPVLSVRGNHDAHLTPALRAALPALDGRWTTVGGVHVGGVGWHGRHFAELPGEDDLRPICDRLRAARPVGGGPIVLLSHYPPTLCVDRLGWAPDGWCSTAVDALARDLRPDAILVGHLHGWSGQRSTITWPDGRTCRMLNPGKIGEVFTIG